jgi:cytochrome oxidase Cu insertion factor (SCO1/SenC/PrrC family)
MSTPSPDPGRAAPDDTPRVRPWTIWALIAIIAVGGVVGTQLLFKRIVPEVTNKARRLPYLTRLEKDLEAVDSSGKTVRLSQLDGKVFLIAYVYTTCPRGCAEVVDKMRSMQEKFGSDPRFQLVSVSLNPSHDTPEQLAKFRDAHGLTAPNWWFLTGDQEALRYYMTKQVNLRPVRDIPEKERLSPEDLFEHDTRVALVDTQSHVREYYDVTAPDPGINRLVMDKLEADIAAVLAEIATPETQAASR